MLQRMSHRHKQASYICTSSPALPTQLPKIPRPFTSCLHNKQHLVHIKPPRKNSILVLMDSFQEHSIYIYVYIYTCIYIYIRVYIYTHLFFYMYPKFKDVFQFPIKKRNLPVFFSKQDTTNNQLSHNSPRRVLKILTVN